jgi:hypothetical protein
VFRLTRSVLSLLLAGGLAVTTAGAPAAATGSAAPAAATGAAPAAGGTIDRQRAESGHGTKPDKSATAGCPDGQTVIGAGGRIEDNDGTVVLTGVVPTTTSVTATAAALPDQPATAWSVVAVAVCRQITATTTNAASITAASTNAAASIAAASATAAGPAAPAPGAAGPTTVVTGSSTADCPGGTVLSGSGFALAGTAGQALLTGLVPDPWIGRVTATAVLRAPGVAAPTAYAICVPPEPGNIAVRVEGASASDTTAPKTATAAGSPYGRVAQVYGVGGLVTGPVSDVFLDVLVPDPGLASGTARASKLAGGTDPGAWSLTAYGTDAYSYS